MPEQKLLDYINQQLKNGVPQEDVKKALMGAGWQPSFIDEAFNSIGGQKFAVPIPEVKASLTPSKPATTQTLQPQQQPAARQEAQPAPNKLPPLAEAPLPFKVQSVPQDTINADVSSEPGNGPAQMPGIGKQPIEKNEIISQKETLPADMGEKKADDSKFLNQVPKVSELDKAFGQTFGVAQGSAVFEPAVKPLKPISEQFSSDQKPAPLSNEAKGGVAGMTSEPIVNDSFGVAAPVFKREADPVSDEKLVLDSKKADPNDSKELSGDLEGHKPKKNKKVFIFLLLGIVGAMLLGGAVFAYFFYFKPSSDSILKTMSQKLGGVKTASISGNISISVPATADVAADDAASGSFVDIGIDFTGVLDATNDMTSSITFNETDNFMSGSNAIKFETVNSKDAVYFKAGEISGSGAADLVLYEDQWIKIDGSKMPREFESVFPIYSKIKEGAGAGDIDLGQLNRILLVTNNPGVMVLKDKLADEAINGIDCIHYSFELDKDALKREISAALEGSNSADTNNYNLIIDKATIAGEIWIGKKDTLPYKAVYSLINNTGADLAASDLRIVVSGYNSPVLVAVPDQYRLGSEIFYEVAAKKEQLARESEVLLYDNTRMSDMKLFFGAQKKWYLANKRFYTCSSSDGDCGGKPFNLPSVIGDFANLPLADPQNTGTICGQDFVYCGLDNSKNPKSFCYYAKMSDGSFFTASAYGNFRRENFPRSFKECQQGTLVE